MRWSLLLARAIAFLVLATCIVHCIHTLQLRWFSVVPLRAKVSCNPLIEYLLICFFHVLYVSRLFVSVTGDVSVLFSLSLSLPLSLPLSLSLCMCICFVLYQCSRVLFDVYYEFALVHWYNEEMETFPLFFLLLFQKVQIYFYTYMSLVNWDIPYTARYTHVQKRKLSWCWLRDFVVYIVRRVC